jgi:uncharacterized protein YbjT (DUF2867 family)
MRVLVTGVSGYVGSLLVPQLLAAGQEVRGLARDPDRVERVQGMDIEVVRGDALSGEGLAEALQEVEVAYYLIHSMERVERGQGQGRSFQARERRSAETFAQAAQTAGVRRIVYLGGLLGEGQSAAQSSRHLSSREGVERILLDAIPDSVALRASIVIGARSRSFRLLVRLVERMPVLALPAWRSFRTQPIDERDVAAMLLACAAADVGGRSLDVGGPDVLSYGEMIERIAELMLVHRPTLGLGINVTMVTARVAAAIASEDPELVLPLMESLQRDLLPRDDHAAELLGVHLHKFEPAVEHALSEWERAERLAAR